MNRRLEICRRRVDAATSISISPAARALADRPWLAIVSSHLGRSVRLHAEMCRYLNQSIVDARRREAVLLVARGTAIFPWVRRAAELFGFATIEIELTTTPRINRNLDARIVQVTDPKKAGRDDVLAALADRVDCVFLRPAGKVFAALRRRVCRSDVTVRVALHQPMIFKGSERATKELMRSGAVGWYCCRNESEHRATRATDASESAVRDVECRPWDETSRDWLVHCTRVCDGPWPGQTERQHRDALLLCKRANLEASSRSPLATLRQILRTRRLIGSAIATNQSYRVVCFSACPLGELLRRRRYRSHLHRWDYEPYGIALRKSAAERLGIRPVVYGTDTVRQSLGESERYLFQSVGKTYDWTIEKEWRFQGDLEFDRCADRDIRVFVRRHNELQELKTDLAVSVVGDLIDDRADALV